MNPFDLTGRVAAVIGGTGVLEAPSATASAVPAPRWR